MDKEHATVLQELNNMQLKISYLFLDLMKEKNEHKQNSENLSKKVEQLTDELYNLKKQNKALKQNNQDMKNVIEKGVKVFQSLDLSNINLFRDYKTALEALKKTFFQFIEKIENSKSIDVALRDSLENGKKSVDLDSPVCKLNDEEIQKELEGLSHSDFFTSFSYNEAYVGNSFKREHALDRSRSDTVLKSLPQNTFSTIKISKESSSDCENESLDSKSLNTIVDGKIGQLTPLFRERDRCVNRSPVFKDFGIRRHDSSSNDENGSNSSTPLKLINERFLEKSEGSLVSPCKISPRRAIKKTPTKTPSAAKPPRKRLKINSPERSQFGFLKKSNMREAEISFSGIRKLRQTVLNVDRYKKKSFEIRESENGRNRTESDKKENKEVTVDEDDDDFIIESPQKDDQMLEDVKIKQSELDLKVPSITRPKTSDSDIDETYISSSFIQKCATNKDEIEKLIQNQTPLKRQKSPEYGSVPFVYKREPVRKRAERMKLPGHACLECMKYYENAFEDINTQGLKEVLNKCSRHRDKNSPTLDDTPPGYWKPYLTCSTIISPNKDGVCKVVN